MPVASHLVGDPCGEGLTRHAHAAPDANNWEFASGHHRESCAAANPEEVCYLATVEQPCLTNL
jgi:hypothetical protein